jgi:hypothetical protein
MPRKSMKPPLPSVAARVFTCHQTGAPIVYKGRGRPPKYAPDVRKQRSNERSAAYYKARKAEFAAMKAALARVALAGAQAA